MKLQIVLLMALAAFAFAEPDPKADPSIEWKSQYGAYPISYGLYRYPEYNYRSIVSPLSYTYSLPARAYNPEDFYLRTGFYPKY